MYKLLTLTQYQFKLQMRDLLNLFFIFVFPPVVYLFFSSILSQGESMIAGADAIDFLLPMYIAMIIGNTVLINFGTLLVNHKERNYFIKYKLMGLDPLKISVGLFVSVFLFQVLGISFLLVISTFVKGSTLPMGNGIQIIMAFLLMNFFQFSLAFLLSSFINRSRQYQSIIMMVYYFQMFLGGMTLPPEFFPKGLRLFTEIFNPVVHGVYVLRGTWIHGKSILDFPKEIVILLGFSAVSIAIGSRFFKWEPKQI